MNEAWIFFTLWSLLQGIVGPPDLGPFEPRTWSYCQRPVENFFDRQGSVTAHLTPFCGTNSGNLGWPGTLTGMRTRF